MDLHKKLGTWCTHMAVSPLPEPSLQDIVKFIQRSNFVWHQRLDR
jgi:hypothetical protein